MIIGVIASVAAVKWLMLVRLARRYTVDILYQDMWVFYAPYFNDQGYFQAFVRQHGPHRMGVGLVYEGIVMKSTGWNVRTLAQSVTFVLLGSAVLHLVALHRQVRRLSIGDAVIPIWLMSERLGEHVVVWPSTSHSFFALLFLSVIALSLTANSPAVRWGVTSLVVPLTVFTGFGVLVGPVLVVVVVSEVIRTGWRRVHTVACIVLIVTYAGYFWNFNWSFTQRFSGGRLRSARSWGDSLLFASYMVASLLGVRKTGMLAVIAGLLGITAFVGVVMLAFVKLAQGNKCGLRTSGPLLLCLYTLTYVGAASVGRQPWFGPQAAFQPRYLAGVVPGLLGLWWLVRDRAERSCTSTKRRLLLGAAAIVLAIPALTVPEKKLFHRTCIQKRVWLREYLETGDVESANEASMGDLLTSQADRRQESRKLLDRRIEYLRDRRLSFFRDRGGADPVNEATC